MNVAKITAELAGRLKGTEYEDNSFFNPIQDFDDNWVVSLTEAQYLDLNDFEVITYKPKVYEPLIGY